MTILERCAYLKGMADGLDLHSDKPETKLLLAMLDAINEIAEEVQSNADNIDELAEYAEELDHDLGDVESYVFECDDDDDDCCCDDDDDDDWDCDDCDEGDCDDCDCDCCCDDEDYYEAECPHCGETVCFDSEIEPEDMICPACNKKFSDAD